jgi:hypothetical protein
MYVKAFEIIEGLGYRVSKTKKHPGFDYRVQNSSLMSDERSDNGAAEKFVVMYSLRRAGYNAEMLGTTQAVHFGAKVPDAEQKKSQR